MLGGAGEGSGPDAGNAGAGMLFCVAASGNRIPGSGAAAFMLVFIPGTGASIGATGGIGAAGAGAGALNPTG
jgi:hypothetical protein